MEAANEVDLGTQKYYHHNGAGAVGQAAPYRAVRKPKQLAIAPPNSCAGLFEPVATELTN